MAGSSVERVPAIARDCRRTARKFAKFLARPGKIIPVPIFGPHLKDAKAIDDEKERQRPSHGLPVVGQDFLESALGGKKDIEAKGRRPGPSLTGGHSSLPTCQ